MPDRNKKIHFRRSFSTILIIQICAVAFFLIGMVSLCLYASIRMIGQSQAAKLQIIEMTMERMDERLQQVTNGMSGYMVSYENEMEEIGRNDKDQEVSWYRLIRGLQGIFSTDDITTFLFLYHEAGDRLCGSRNGTLTDWIALYRNEQDNINNKTRGLKNWYVEEVGGNFFLVRTMFRNGFYLTAYVSTDHFLNEMLGDREVFDEVFLLDTEHAPAIQTRLPESVVEGLRECEGTYTETKPFASYALFGVYAKEQRLWLAGVSRNTLAEKGIFIFLLLSGICMLLMLGYLIAYGIYQRENLVKPSLQLTAAMEEVEKGNLEIQVNEEESYEELARIGKAFNHMVGEISRLKIEVYEEQLLHKNAELKFLQLQINPHFFLNAMNILYSLALTKQTDRIKELVSHLMLHTRFVLKARSKTILLEEELGHIRNFVEIQKIRYRYPIRLNIVGDQEYGRQPVPPMMIYTFVENSVKYGLVDEQEGVHIELTIWTEMQEDNFCIVRVRDHGKGYGEDILPVLQKGETVIDSRKEEHYGVANVVQRLRLLYKGRERILFENAEDGGALTEIWIPFGEENRDENIAGR